MFNNSEFPMQPMQHPQVQQQQHMVQSLHIAPALTAQSGGQQLNTAAACVQLSQQQQWNAQVFQNALHATAFWRRFRSVELHVVFLLKKINGKLNYEVSYFNFDIVFW